MKRLIFAVVAIVLALVAAVAVWLLLGAEQPYKGYGADEQFVEIPPGAGPGAIGRRLTEAGVVRDESSFRVALWRSAMSGAYSLERYHFCACSMEGNSSTTRRLGDHPPSSASILPPRTRNRPPYFCTVAATCLR